MVPAGENEARSGVASQRWLTPAELSAWTKFIAVVELLPGVLDSQLQRDSELTHFEYFTLAMLSETPHRTLRMSELAVRTNSTLPRLSHVASRLEARGYLERRPSDDDRRAINVSLTAEGWQKVRTAAPGHVDTVLATVITPLTPADITDLDRIMGRMLGRLDPENTFWAHDE
ncbi:MarR family winged helix-turn-helix transcriptional regulator [Subtercola lobariae]|nr:MarR family transcriptional regulator [Subtercola lobariae]